MRLRDPRRQLARLLRRHRRIVAAVLAATGLLVAMSSLRPAPAVDEAASVSPTGLRAGEVALPMSLSTPAIARILSPGDIVDVVGLTGPDGDQHASIVASGTRVLSVPDGSSTFGTSSGAVVLIAVDEAGALAISTVMAMGPVSVLIRSRAATG